MTIAYKLDIHRNYYKVLHSVVKKIFRKSLGKNHSHKWYHWFFNGKLNWSMKICGKKILKNQIQIIKHNRIVWLLWFIIHTYNLFFFHFSYCNSCFIAFIHSYIFIDCRVIWEPAVVRIKVIWYFDCFFLKWQSSKNKEICFLYFFSSLRKKNSSTRTIKKWRRFIHSIWSVMTIWNPSVNPAVQLFTTHLLVIIGAINSRIN